MEQAFYFRLMIAFQLLILYYYKESDLSICEKRIALVNIIIVIFNPIKATCAYRIITRKRTHDWVIFIISLCIDVKNNYDKCNYTDGFYMICNKFLFYTVFATNYFIVICLIIMFTIALIHIFFCLITGR